MVISLLKWLISCVRWLLIVRLSPSPICHRLLHSARRKEDATDELAYEIFKSFTDKKVSKAITAQYMARLIDVKVNKSQEDKKSMQGILLKDPYLRYLVNAICHVTKPIEGLDE